MTNRTHVHIEDLVESIDLFSSQLPIKTEKLKDILGWILQCQWDTVISYTQTLLCPLQGHGLSSDINVSKIWMCEDQQITVIDIFFFNFSAQTGVFNCISLTIFISFVFFFPH